MSTRANWRGAVGALVLALMIGSPLVGQARDAVQILPASTNLLARLDVAGIMASSLATELFAENGARFAVMRALLATILGFDLEEIETAWLLASEPDERLVVLEGRFVADDIAGRLGMLPELENREIEGVRHVSSFIDEGDGRVKLAAVLGDELLAVGDEMTMLALIAVWRGDIEALSTKHPGVRWVVKSKDHLAATLLDLNSWPELDPGSAAILEGVWLSVLVTEDILATLELEAADAQGALGLEHLLRGLLILAPQHPDIQRQPAALSAVKLANLIRDGTDVSLSMTIPGDQVFRAEPEE